MSNKQPTELNAFLGNLKQGIWLLGVSSWLFGITDRSIASFSDGYLSALDITQLFTASFFFVSWLFLKPKTTLGLYSNSTQPDLGDRSLEPPTVGTALTTEQADQT